MFCGIGLCDGSPGLSLAGPPGVTMFEHATVKPSAMPSQSLSRPSQVSVVGVCAEHGPNTPAAQGWVPRHAPVPHCRVMPSSIDPSQSSSLLLHSSPCGTQLQPTRPSSIDPSQSSSLLLHSSVQLPRSVHVTAGAS